MKNSYRHIALGGTFDILHAGHKKLLAAAFEAGQRVTIGITTDKFCAKLGINPLQNQYVRKKILYKFLKKLGLLDRAHLIFIEDIYGPTIVDKLYQALVVSKQTLSNALKINKKRVQLGFSKLDVVMVPLALAYNGKPISTTRIRSGEIDTYGQSYQKMLAKITGKRLKEGIRKKLKKPFGKIIKADKSLGAKPNIITVGDVSTLTFNSLKIPRKLSIVDFLTDRKRVYDSLYDIGFTFPNPSEVVKNHSGQISKPLILAISKMLKSTQSNHVILVDGEEDLAAICAIMLAPIPSTLFYGQPMKGLVMVEVDIEAKNRLCRLLGLS